MDKILERLKDLGEYLGDTCSGNEIMDIKYNLEQELAKSKDFCEYQNGCQTDPQAIDYCPYGSKDTEIIDRLWTIRNEMVAENDTTLCSVEGEVKSKAQQYLEECIDELAKLEG